MADENKNVATAKDALFFQTILCSMKNRPDVDWAVVAAKAGYKDGRTASTRYGQIMKKLTGVSAGKAMSGGGASPISPIKTAAKKTGAGAGAGRGVKKASESGISNGVIGAKVAKPRKKAENGVKKIWEDEHAHLDNGDDFDEFDRYHEENGGFGDVKGGFADEPRGQKYVDSREDVEF